MVTGDRQTIADNFHRVDSLPDILPNHAGRFARRLPYDGGVPNLRPLQGSTDAIGRQKLILVSS